MSSSFNRIKKNIIEAMQSTNNQGTSAYDSVAEVRRVDGDTAWVHIAGGVDETPVKLTIAAKAGDVVQVRVGGGRAWITGNASAPPTDDKTAIAAKSLANLAGSQANVAQKTADQAQIMANSALKGTKENAAQMAQMVINFNGDIENLQDQIDGNISTWFYDVDPAMGLPPVTDWDTDEKKDAHLGDIYYNTVNGYAWRFMKSGGIYSWERITDTGVTKALADAAKAQDTADSKRRVFYNTPTVPYDAGDLWVQGSGGDILRCAQAKTGTGSYDRNDWVLASKYTDNSALNTWIEGDFATTIKELEDGLVDAKIETYYQTTDPSTGWSDTQKSEHKGDLWYNSTASVQKYYRWSGTAWQELTATPPQAVFDNIDRKATIYVGTTTPTNPESGDLWFKGANEPILTYVNSSWVEYNKYTDDTAAKDAQEKAKATAAHFWSGTEGAHVTYTEEGEEISGGNVLISTDGLSVRDGETTLASFGENGAIIGKNGSQQIVITPNALTAINSEGQTAVRIASEHKEGTKEITEIYPGNSKKIKISYIPEENSEVAIKLNRADPNDYDVSEVTFIHKTGESDKKQLSLHNMPVYATYNAEDIVDGVTVKLEYAIDDDTKYVNTVEVRYSTTQVNIVAASFANGKFEVGWSGNTTTHGSIFASGNITASGDIVPGKITGIANLIYPVGSIYMSANSTSPATLFGGTWERIQDRFLLAAGSTYAAGGFGGEATHTLTEAELPNHRHTFTTDSAGDHTHSLDRVLGNSGGNWTGDTAGDLSGSGRKFGYIDSKYGVKTVTDTGSGGAHTHTGTTNGTGGNGKHNNMPPYLTVYMWKRTA